MIKIGIIGCGGIAFGKHLPNLKLLDDVELVAFCDLDVERATKAKDEYGTPDARIYTDYLDLLAEPLDVVHVLTPNNTHATITIAALDHKKHVMCEKPMAKYASEAREMIAAAKRNDKKLTVGYQNRFRSDSMFLKKIAQENQLGHIYLGKAKAIRRRAVPTWGVFLDEEAQGGGPLIDIGTHALDLTLWTMNNYKPKYAVGTTYHELSQTPDAANAWGSWDPTQFTVEDSAFGFVVMENGATIILESSWALNTLDVGEAKTSLYGTKMGADMEQGLRLNGEEHGALYQKNIDFEIGGVDFYDSKGTEPGYLEARAWIDAITMDTPPVVDPYEALIVTEILEAIYTSASTGKPVYFEEDTQ